MSEREVILKQDAGVKSYDSDSPSSVGLKAGAFAEVGTLILTNKRLVYISKGGASRSAAWALGGALAASAVEKGVSRAEIDEFMNCKGSYYTPLQEITRVETARKLGSGYLRVDNCSPSQKPVHSYIFGGGWSTNEDWVSAINAARATIHSSPAQHADPAITSVNQESYSTPPPPPPPPIPKCPYCNNPIRYIHQYQRWYCDNEKKYV